jgi:hypothetical protein
VWKSVGLMTGQHYTEVPIVFEDVRFHKATSIPKQGLCDSIVHYTFNVYANLNGGCLYISLFHQYV